MRQNKTIISIVSAFCLALVTATAANAQCALPYTLTNGQLANATQVMANFKALANCLSPGGPTNSVQYNNSAGLSGIAPLSNGQLVIGSTGAVAQPQTVVPGPGIATTNVGGGITFSATGGAAGNGVFSPNMSATPTSSGTGLTTWLNQGTAAVSDSAVGVCINAPSSGTSGNVIARYMSAPSTPYTFTALIAATRNSASANGVGIGWYDGTAKLHIASFTTNAGAAPLFQVNKWNSVTSFNASDVTSAANAFAQPIWLQIHDDGTNVSFAFSQDGVAFLSLFSVAKSSGFLGAAGYSNIVFFVNPQGSQTLGTLLSWTQS
jgi:hypothetical protein